MLRDAEHVAGTIGITFAQTNLLRPRSVSRNRMMRTRMSGGVGRAISDDGPYPISAIGFLSLHRRGGSLRLRPYLRLPCTQ